MEADGQLFVQEHPKDQIEECWEVALAKILYFGLGNMFWVFLSVKFFVFDMFFWHFSPYKSQETAETISQESSPLRWLEISTAESELRQRWEVAAVATGTHQLQGAKDRHCDI